MNIFIGNERTVYGCKRLTVEECDVKFSDGRSTIHTHVKCPPAVAVLCITKDNKIIFVKQTRTAAGVMEVLELPAGLVEDGEEPILAAIREMEEETGYHVNNLKLLHEYYTSIGFTNEKLYLYGTADVEEIGEQHLDENEDIELVLIDVEEALTMLDEGKFVNATTIIALNNLKARKLRAAVDRFIEFA